ncbi:MAG: gamma-glutamyl-gamma-aminobutyrate hydrolase family protein [Alphaproteobacteria bacterium]
MKRPVIGLTLDWRDGGDYSLYPWYAMRENYCSSVRDAGGLPILIPFHHKLIDQYLDSIDGLIITGGDLDVDPALYGDSIRHESVKIIEKRSNFEWDLTKGAIERDMPILGICGGHQLLNVALGGSLIQHIPAEIPTQIEHEQPNPRNEPGHSVEIIQGTLLHDIIGQNQIMVNSAHHQAVKDPAPSVRINSRAPDDVIEGFEDTSKRFCLGIQWHPEFIITDADSKIFSSFVHSCT